MEAADDIAYCMSDIADGIEKRILTFQEFLIEFKETWDIRYPGEKLPYKLPIGDKEATFNRSISVPWSRDAMKRAVDSYFENHDNVYSGSAEELISKDCPMGKVLDTMKAVSRKVLYTSIEAESIELTGYAVITGILKKYERLLKLPNTEFNALVEDREIKDRAVERRLFNRIGKRYVKAYTHALEDPAPLDDVSFEEKEWWLRVHMLIDHVSGMTDEFALETYQMLEGISLLRT